MKKVFTCPYNEMDCPFLDTLDNSKYVNCSDCSYFHHGVRATGAIPLLGWLFKKIKSWFVIVIMFVPINIQAQRWSDINKGLYPNAMQVTFNAKNHATGLKYDYLFKNQFGIYGSFSRTIRPNLWINNYRWENKYSIGIDITLPADGITTVHSIVSIGLVYNQHPREWQNELMPSGMYYAPYKVTTPIGLDLGWRAQVKKWTVGFQIDIMNFFQYGQLSFGRCFSFYK
jgi:hypothetical protein